MASVEQDGGAGSAEKICVAIRMRPLNEREKNSGQEACFRVNSEQNSIVQLKGSHYRTFLATPLISIFDEINMILSPII